VKRIERKREAAMAAATRAAMRVGELSRVDVILLLYVFIVSFLYL
jgi:hypothetical protein